MNNNKILLVKSVLIILFTLSLPIAAADQDIGNTNMEILREKVEADKKLLVASNMSLTEAEAKAFWPIYEEYQKDLGKHNKRLADIIVDYAEAYNTGSISDATAKQLMTDYLDIEKSLIDMKKTYLDKLSRVLPAAKSVRYLQIENKIAAVQRFKLADGIPLVYR